MWIQVNEIECAHCCVRSSIHFLPFQVILTNFIKAIIAFLPNKKQAINKKASLKRPLLLIKIHFNQISTNIPS